MYVTHNIKGIADLNVKVNQNQINLICVIENESVDRKREYFLIHA